MLVYHIGEVFPHPELKRVGFDAPRAMIIPNGFFNIVLHSNQPQLDKELASAAMHVGLYQKDAIPFVLLNWPGKLAFEVILNVHTLTDANADAWLNGAGNTVIFFVLDAHTNVIVAMRTFTIPPIVAEKIRDCLEKQDQQYSNAVEVDVRMEAIMTEVPLQTMFERGKLFRIG